MFLASVSVVVVYAFNSIVEMIAFCVLCSISSAVDGSPSESTFNVGNFAGVPFLVDVIFNVFTEYGASASFLNLWLNMELTFVLTESNFNHHPFFPPPNS